MPNEQVQSKDPDQSDWYNIPAVVVEKISQFAKVIAKMEIRQAQSEQEIIFLKQQNEVLQHNNDLTKQNFQDFFSTVVKFATSADLMKLKHEIQNFKFEPQNNYIEQLKQQLQQQLNPEYFQPIIQQQLQLIQSQFQNEFIEVYQQLEQKPSKQQTFQLVNQKFGEISDYLTQFKQKLTGILQQKADIVKVNEVLQQKCDITHISTAMNQLVDQQKLNSIVTDIKENSLKTFSQQISVLKQEMQSQIDSNNQEINNNSVSSNQLLKKLNELNVKQTSNSQQIVELQSDCQQAIILSKQIKQQQMSEISQIADPLIQSIKQLNSKLYQIENDIETIVSGNIQMKNKLHKYNNYDINGQYVYQKNQ